jgi:hypothetical protein
MLSYQQGLVVKHKGAASTLHGRLQTDPALSAAAAVGQSNVTATCCWCRNTAQEWHTMPQARKPLSNAAKAGR